ncbi:MAG: PadR family transcriptional regulator [Thermocrispum sp.]
MSATRLLVLGVVHLSGGAHGYQVRTELRSWRADSWARINPGSIYHALKKAARDGLLAETAQPGKAGPERTLYRITDAGLREIVELAGQGLRRTQDPWMLNAALAMLPLLRREDAIALLAERQRSLRGERIELRQWLANPDPDTPQHVREQGDLWTGHVDAELRWVANAIERLTAGRYVMAGESD